MEMSVIGFLLTIVLCVALVIAVDLISKKMMVEVETRKLIMLLAGTIAIIYLIGAFLGKVPYFRI